MKLFLYPKVSQPGQWQKNLIVFVYLSGIRYDDSPFLYVGTIFYKSILTTFPIELFANLSYFDILIESRGLDLKIKQDFLFHSEDYHYQVKHRLKKYVTELVVP